MIGDHGLHPFTAILWNTISSPNNKLSADLNSVILQHQFTSKGGDI